MGLKIIGAGFGRTGTLSTQHALNELGFPCYHMKEIRKKGNQNHLDFWLEVAEAPPGTQQDWDKIFHNYTASIDFPSSCVWQELFAANPESKVLLTLHPGGPEAWYRSTRETIYATSSMWEAKLLSYFIPPFRKMTKMTSKLIWGRFLQGTMEDKSAAIMRYNQHIEEVRRIVPPEQLLVFSADQGWEPLCAFLDKEVPKKAFPRVNDKAEMKKMIKLLAYATRGLILLIVLGLVGLWFLVR